jgi:hypothetical protein
MRCGWRGVGAIGSSLVGATELTLVGAKGAKGLTLVGAKGAMGLALGVRSGLRLSVNRKPGMAVAAPV